MGAPPAGWYPDPQSGHGVRYWNGAQWTDQTAPSPPPATWGGWQPPPSFAGASASGSAASQPARLSTWVTVLVVLFTVRLVFLAFVGFSDDGRNGHSDVAALPTTPTPLPEVTPVYHLKLDANGDPAYVAFPRRRPGMLPVGVPPGLTTHPTGSDVIDPATARTVVQQLWDARRAAIAAQNTAVVADLETGSALAIDADRACGCATGDRFGPASGIEVAVPHQHALPATFFAQLNTTFNGSRWASVLVFSRSSNSDHWRLAFAGGGQPVGNAPGFPFALAPDGFARPAPTHTVPVPPTVLLANYWQHVKDDGTVKLPATLRSATLTDVWAAHLVESRQGDVNDQNGLIGYYHFYADPTTDTYDVSLTDGTVLECASIQEEKFWMPGRGDTVDQPQTLRNWGPDVAAGSYGAVLEVGEYTPCFQYVPGVPVFQPNGVVPPDDIQDVGLAPAAQTM